MLAAAVWFVIGLSGHRPDQFVQVGVGDDEMKSGVGCVYREYCSLAIDVEELKGARRRGGLGVDGDLVEGFGQGQSLAT